MRRLAFALALSTLSAFPLAAQGRGRVTDGVWPGTWPTAGREIDDDDRDDDRDDRYDRDDRRARAERAGRGEQRRNVMRRYTDAAGCDVKEHYKPNGDYKYERKCKHRGKKSWKYADRTDAQSSRYPTTCVDVNGDGRCDRYPAPPRRDPTICVDRNRDGYCDATYPAQQRRTIPEIVGAILGNP